MTVRASTMLNASATGCRSVPRKWKALLRSSLLVQAALVCTATPALAQTAAPPNPLSLDERGVELNGGVYITGATDLAIGPGDHHGLTFTRQWVDSGWRIAELPTLSGSTSNPIVSFGGRSLPFTKVGSVFTADFEDGSTLTQSGGNYTFTSSSGVEVTFLSSQYMNQMMDANLGLGQKITYPDGVEVTFHHHQDVRTFQGTDFTLSRLSAITSNTGFMIKLEYASSSPEIMLAWSRVTKATAINNAVEYCGPYASCSLTNDWPEVSYVGWNLNGLSSVTDAAGDTTNYSYVNGRLTGIRRPGATSDTVVIGYDTSDRVDEVAVAGGAWTYTYGSNSTTVTNPDSGTVVVDFDGVGLVEAQTVGSQTTTFDYCTSIDTNCPEGLLKSAETPEGQTTAYQYDTRGNVTQITSADANEANPITTSATYASTCSNPVTCNKPITTTDAAGQLTNYDWSSVHGGLTEVILPAAGTGEPRATTKLYYTSKVARYLTAAGTYGNGSAIYVNHQTNRCRIAATCFGTVNEVVTQITYPSSGAINNLQPSAITTRLGNDTEIATTAITYNDLAQVASVDGPLSGASDTSYVIYDDAGRTIGSISPDPDGGNSLPRLASRITYEDGLVITQETGTATGTDLLTFNAEQRHETEYDDYGRPIIQRYRDRDVTGSTQFSVVQTSYDNSGRVDCTALRMNAPLTTTPLEPDACTPMSAGSSGPDRISQNVYDDYGRLLEVHSGVGSTALAQITQKISYRSGWDENGQVEWVEDALGNRTTFIYDAFGRLYRTNYPSTTTAHVANTSDYDRVYYDSAGRIWKFRNRMNEKTEITFDNLGRATRLNIPARGGSLDSTHTRDIYYGYDLFGNLEYAYFDCHKGGTCGTEEGVDLIYNALGQLLSESNNMDGVTRTISHQYDVAGRHIRITHPDSAFFTYGYDVLNRIGLIEDQGGGNLQSHLYQADGRLQRRNGGSTTTPNQFFYYDDAGRMTSTFIDHASATYDVDYDWAFNPAGQVAAETRDNDLFAFGDHEVEDIAYVANGLNQYAAVEGAAFTYDANGNITSDSTTAFMYDSQNLMVEAINGAAIVTLRYDPLGRLYEVEDKVGATVTSVRRLYYSGTDLIAEYDANGTMLDRYVHGVSGGDDPLVSYAGSSTAISNARFLYADRLGSIVFETDRYGNNRQINAYDEYGVEDGGNAGRFGYTGQAFVPEIGMSYYKARMYSAWLGRFYQPDPIGYGDGMNMYAYVGNDPVNGVDYWGLKECDSDDQGPCDIIVTAGRFNYSSLGGAARTGLDLSDLPRGSLNINNDGDPDTIVVIGERQSGRGTKRHATKRLPKCAQDFLRGRITSNPADIVLHDWSPFGSNSVTFDNDIYLTSGTFGPGYARHKFHEIAHTSQYARGYGVSHHIMGYVATSSHDNAPLEMDADDFAQNTYNDYVAQGLDKTCPF